MEISIQIQLTHHFFGQDATNFLPMLQEQFRFAVSGRHLVKKNHLKMSFLKFNLYIILNLISTEFLYFMLLPAMKS